MVAPTPTPMEYAHKMAEVDGQIGAVQAVIAELDRALSLLRRQRAVLGAEVMGATQEFMVRVTVSPDDLQAQFVRAQELLGKLRR